MNVDGFVEEFEEKKSVFFITYFFYQLNDILYFFQNLKI